MTQNPPPTVALPSDVASQLQDYLSTRPIREAVNHWMSLGTAINAAGQQAAHDAREADYKARREAEKKSEEAKKKEAKDVADSIAPPKDTAETPPKKGPKLTAPATNATPKKEAVTNA